MSLLRSKGCHPSDLLDQDAFKQRWEAVAKKCDQEAAKEKALRAAAGDEAEQPEEISDLVKIARGHVVPAPGKYAKDSAEHWVATAAQTVSMYVNLAAEPASRAALSKLVAESTLSLPSVSGTVGKNCVVLLYDCNLWSESARSPQAPPKLQPGAVNKLLMATLIARGATEDITEGKLEGLPAGDVVVFNDAGLEANSAVLQGVFKRGSVETTKVILAIGEDTIRQRKKRNFGEIHQIQTLHFLTNSGTTLERCLPEKTHSLYPGTSRGTVIAWVGLVPPGEMWTASVAAKKEIYGLDKVIGTLAWLRPERPRASLLQRGSQTPST